MRLITFCASLMRLSKRETGFLTHDSFKLMIAFERTRKPAAKASARMPRSAGMLRGISTKPMAKSGTAARLQNVPNSRVNR
jgi:hypothetical protein